MRSRALASCLALGALAGCEAELVPAFIDGPAFEILLAGEELDVKAILLHPELGPPLLVGGPEGGPPLLARLEGGALTPLPAPADDRSPRAAATDGRAVWLAGPGLLWDGSPEALGPRPLPAPDLELSDVALRPGGGLAAAVGPGALVVRRPGELPEQIALAATSSSGLGAVWIGSDGRLWLGGAAGLVGVLDPGGRLLALDAPGSLARSLDGAAGRVYAAGGEAEGWVAEIAGPEPRDLSVGGMPRLHVVRAEGDEVWVGGDGGFLARFDGETWRAFELPVGGARIEALAIESEGRVLVGGEGFVGRFRSSRL